jgi:hypothetical protein
VSPLKIKISKTNKYTNYSFTLLIMYPTCFGITLPPSGSVPSGFWEMLNWGAVDTILWMGVLSLVTWWACAPTIYYISRLKVKEIHEALSAAQLQTSSKEEFLLVNYSEEKYCNVFFQNQLAFSQLHWCALRWRVIKISTKVFFTNY